jgi:hypothetical protein
MDIYTLNRNFVDFSFENPSKIKPNHYALFFFAIEHCNRLGWKKEFGLPTTMTMEAIGIKSYNTYSKTFNDLVEYGFFKLVQKSTNQYSANIIALSNFDKPLDKALDKAFIKHATKQSESTQQSIDSIDKQIYNNTNTQYSEELFLENWSTCRQHYLKHPTNIKKLNFHESGLFNEIKKEYSKDEINQAMQTLFKQERIPVDAMVLRPKHFLEKFDTYYTGKGNTKIYGSNV